MVDLVLRYVVARDLLLSKNLTQQLDCFQAPHRFKAWQMPFLKSLPDHDGPAPQSRTSVSDRTC